jgi:hypothetical protein
VKITKIEVVNSLRILNEKINTLDMDDLSEYELEGIYNKIMDVVDYLTYVVSKHPKDLIKGKR